VITVRRKPGSTSTPLDPQNIYLLERQPMQGNKQTRAVESRHAWLRNKRYRRDQMKLVGKPPQAYPLLGELTP
jgi:hypothetical protein